MDGIRRAAVVMSVVLAASAASAATTIKLQPGEKRGGAVAERRAIRAARPRPMAARQSRSLIRSAPVSPRFIPASSPPSHNLRRTMTYSSAVPKMPAKEDPRPLIKEDFLRRVARRHRRDERVIKLKELPRDKVTPLGPIGNLGVVVMPSDKPVVLPPVAGGSGDHNRDQGGRPAEPKSEPGSKPAWAVGKKGVVGASGK